MLTIGPRSFQRGTVGLCGSKGYNVTNCQSWRLEKILVLRQSREAAGGTGSSARKFDHPQSLTGRNFAAL